MERKEQTMAEKIKAVGCAIMALVLAIPFVILLLGMLGAML